jgi:hypothetical protein
MRHHSAGRLSPRQPRSEQRALAYARPAGHHDPAIGVVLDQELVEPIQQRGASDEPVVSLAFRREVDQPRRPRRWRQGY